MTSSPGRRARKRGKAPYMGRIDTRWCRACNVPVIKGSTCPGCKTVLVNPGITPPGDSRPAFDHDVIRLRKAVDDTFGAGSGDYMFPAGVLVLFNKVGSADLDYQVVANGKWHGNLRYDLFTRSYSFVPAMFGAMLLYKMHVTRETLTSLLLPRGFIEYRVELESYPAQGKDLLVPGILRMDETFVQGDPCIVFSTNGIIAVGYYTVSPVEAATFRDEGKGRIAKLKHHASPLLANDIEEPGSFPPSSWDDAVRVNASLLGEIESESINFIRKVVDKFKLPVATAYSGGKDSLVTLLLVEKAHRKFMTGASYSMFFADTGLEFPEVIQNVHDVVAWIGPTRPFLERAIGDKFWDLVEGFGPPACDFRFCCHALKASQINDMIDVIGAGHGAGDAPSKVLVFLGQRRYESFKRAEERRVYVNSYVPNQVVASPIKDWTALEEWLYMFREKARDPSLPINPLYFKGHDRLGCYLCPAQSVASLEQVRATHPDMHARWMEVLERHARDRGLPREWIDWGLWRYKVPRGPHAAMFKAACKGTELERDTTGERVKPATLFLHVEKGVSPCTRGGFSVKARITTPLVLHDILPWVRTLDKRASIDEDAGILFVEGDDVRFVVFADGAIFLQSPDEGFNFDEYLSFLFGVIARAVACQHCGVCASVCPGGAIRSNDGQLEFDISRCNGAICQQCTKLCPVFHVVQKQVKQ